MGIFGAMKIAEVDLGEKSVEEPVGLLWGVSDGRGIIFPNQPFIRNAPATSEWRL